MPRRLEVEITSVRDDGSWKWRAAGAKEPRGDAPPTLMPDGAKVGDVLRAEVEVDVDGITLVSVVPPKPARREPERIELIRPAPRSNSSPPTSTAARVRTGASAATGATGATLDRPATPGTAGTHDRRGTHARRETRGHPPRRVNRGRSDRRRSCPARPATRDRPPPANGLRRERPPRGERPRAEDTRPKPKRLRPNRVHRNALLEELPPEQRPIAVQVFIGGIPAVRPSDRQAERDAANRGQARGQAEPLVAIAEEHPSPRTASGAIRAEAALADVDGSLIFPRPSLGRRPRPTPALATTRPAARRNAARSAHPPGRPGAHGLAE